MVEAMAIIFEAVGKVSEGSFACRSIVEVMAFVCLDLYYLAVIAVIIVYLAAITQAVVS